MRSWIMAKASMHVLQKRLAFLRFAGNGLDRQTGHVELSWSTVIRHPSTASLATVAI
jgi:hypothetical protein